jgi:hypothetical protein
MPKGNKRAEGEMDQPEGQLFEDETANFDPIFKQQVQRLHKLTVYGRWSVVGLLWISIGSLSLWGLRSEIALLRQYFTWVAVRYGLYYNPLPTFGLALCVGMTMAVWFGKVEIFYWDCHTKNIGAWSNRFAGFESRGESSALEVGLPVETQ